MRIYRDIREITDEPALIGYVSHVTTRLGGLFARPRPLCERGCPTLYRTTRPEALEPAELGRPTPALLEPGGGQYPAGHRPSARLHILSGLEPPQKTPALCGNPGPAQCLGQSTRATPGRGAGRHLPVHRKRRVLPPLRGEISLRRARRSIPYPQPQRAERPLAKRKRGRIRLRGGCSQLHLPSSLHLLPRGPGNFLASPHPREPTDPASTKRSQLKTRPMPRHISTVSSAI